MKETLCYQQLSLHMLCDRIVNYLHSVNVGISALWAKQGLGGAGMHASGALSSLQLQSALVLGGQNGARAGLPLHSCPLAAPLFPIPGGHFRPVQFTGAGVHSDDIRAWS